MKRIGLSVLSLLFVLSACSSGKGSTTKPDLKVFKSGDEAATYMIESIDLDDYELYATSSEKR